MKIELTKIAINKDNKIIGLEVNGEVFWNSKFVNTEPKDCNLITVGKITRTK